MDPATLVMCQDNLNIVLTAWNGMDKKVMQGNTLSLSQFMQMTKAMAALWHHQTTSVVHRLDDPTKKEKNTVIASLISQLKKDVTGANCNNRRAHGVAPYMEGVWLLSTCST